MFGTGLWTWGSPDGRLGIKHCKPKADGLQWHRCDHLRTMYGIDQEICTMNAAIDRLEMRLLPEEKGLLARAAQIEGVKLSQFVLAPALKRARKVIAEAEQVTTTAKGYRDVLDALAHPPKPTKALLAALKDYEGAGIKWR
jgi:uncharacterized protein (DUF1778 family)